MQIRTWAFALAVAASLAACGETVSEQAAYGGAAGAGAALLLDGKIVTGAALGAAGNLIYCQANPGRCD